MWALLGLVPFDGTGLAVDEGLTRLWLEATEPPPRDLRIKTSCRSIFPTVKACSSAVLKLNIWNFLTTTSSSTEILRLPHVWSKENATRCGSALPTVK